MYREELEGKAREGVQLMITCFWFRTKQDLTPVLSSSLQTWQGWRCFEGLTGTEVMFNEFPVNQFGVWRAETRGRYLRI